VLEQERAFTFEILSLLLLFVAHVNHYGILALPVEVGLVFGHNAGQRVVANQVIVAKGGGLLR
jgi:hypothetical protein